MKIKYIISFCLLFSISVWANYIDNTYTTTENFIYETSDYLDTSFSGENYAVDSDKLTKAEISYESILEDGQANINNTNIKIRLLFPRFRDKYKISFENYNESKSIDNTKDSQDYLLGIAKDKKRIGLKFRGIEPDLFVSYKLDKNINLEEDYKIYIGNLAIYFADFKFDNMMSLNISKQLDEYTKISFDNSYRFQEVYDDRHEVVHSLNLYYQLDEKQIVDATVSSYSTKDNIENLDLEVDYYYTGVSYKNYFYQNWTYFQIDTGMIFRDENNFNGKARVLFRIGALFGNAKPKFNN